mgnify:CR=1 FL=1
MKTYIIGPEIRSPMLEKMINYTLGENEAVFITESRNLPDLRNSNIIFAVELDEAGFCIPIAQILSKLRESGIDSLASSKGVLLVHSPSELNTKWAAQNIIFQCNMLGCSFMGHPLVEATGSLMNFKTWQKTLPYSLEDICLLMCKKIGHRFFNDAQPAFEAPAILALHASSHITSNTLALWKKVKGYLSDKWNIVEKHVENGIIKDCAGCSFHTCIHYGKQKSCFYGGIMVEEIYPAIEKADALMWICPNYNDSVSANIMAVINRITALYRQLSFYDKYIFSIIVSGNSGSDSVARQLIGALNINKGFRLPPYFAFMATANDPGSIHQIPNIEKLAQHYAMNIIESIRI